MKTIDEINKIQAVVLYVLKSFKDGLDYVKLSKIMYFAQKDYLVTYGKMLVPETFKARKLGPVPTLAYKVVKHVEDGDTEDYPDLKDFENSIVVRNKMAFAAKEPDMDYISLKEKKCLDKWIDYCKDKDSLILSKESHDKAYKRVLRRCGKDPEKDVITCIDMAEAGGATSDIIEYIRTQQLFRDSLM